MGARERQPIDVSLTNIDVSLLFSFLSSLSKKSKILKKKKKVVAYSSDGALRGAWSFDRDPALSPAVLSTCCARHSVQKAEINES